MSKIQTGGLMFYHVTIVTEILLLTQLSDLSVEGAADRSAVQGQPGETVVAHCVSAEQQARDLVPLQGEDVLAHTALQHLEVNQIQAHVRWADLKVD